MKKKLAATLSVVLILGLAVLGILAYLTDTDSDVNVMTLGEVSIAQHEYERATNEDGTYETTITNDVENYVLQDFTQAKPLLPATEIDENGNPIFYGIGNPDDIRVYMGQVGAHGNFKPFINENGQDKIVTVENTGRTDAYVRTIIAFEAGDATFDEWDALIAAIHHSGWKLNVIGLMQINGENYVVNEYIYGTTTLKNHLHEDGILPAGDTTYPNLYQVFMLANGTNEDVEKLDGNKNGKYDILVLSQAVQAAGFDNPQTALDTAFGDVTEAKVVEWFAGMEVPELVSTAAELEEALEAGGNVALTKDITTDEIVIPAGTNATLDLNGKKLTGSAYTTSSGAQSLSNVVKNSGNLTITGEGEIRTRNLINNPGAKLVIDGDIKIEGGAPGGGGSAIWNEGDCVINGATISQANDWNYAIQNVADNASMIINNANVEANHGAISNTGANSEMVVNGGTYNCLASGHVVYVTDGIVTINGGTFKHSQENATAEGNVVVYAAKGSVVINDGVFDSVSAAFKYNSHSNNITVNKGEFLNKAQNAY